jgi:hypothetical protein
MNESTEDKSEIKARSDEVRRWHEEINLALESEKDWRKDAERVLKIYRSEGDSKTRKDTFNILWANTEIKRQSIVNTTPSPDCRRRYGDDDPVGREVSELLNRAISYVLDCQHGLTKLIASANDFLLVGRGEIRVRYKGHMETVESEEDSEDENTKAQEVLGYEECLVEHVNWKEFFHGPAKEWAPPWVGYEHDLTKEECEERFPELASKLSYTEVADKEKQKNDSDISIYRRTKVYEIWDKEEKKVYWIGKDFVDDYLDVIEDPMDLQDFYPSPRPVFAVEDPNSLVPIIEFCQYETLAKELEDITRRLIKLVRACKVRGIADTRISEIEKVLSGDDNEIISATNASALMELGGLDKAIWLLPVDQIIGVINNLQNQRLAVKAQIDELNGMSDIVRGSTNPNETATAQRIKANFASARLDKQKQAFQMFARDVVRLIADVVAKFKRENLTLITGLSYPTTEEKQAAQMKLQMLQQPPMPGMPQPNPQEMQQLQAVIAKPSWEDIEQVLRSDVTREYRIDIETDSTMAADQQAEQEVLASFMQAMAQFTTMAQGAVQSGLMTGEAAKKIMISFTRKFRLGKDVEEELEKPLPPPPPDPAAQAAQAEMQMKQQEFQMKQQGEQQKMQFEQQKHQMEMERMQMELQIEKEKAAIERQKMQEELQIERERLGIEREKLAMSSQQTALKGQYEQAKHSRDMQKLETASVAQ